ncbi:MAG: ABC transporter ATP-binding protein [Mycobacteriales bacterium]
MPAEPARGALEVTDLVVTYPGPPPVRAVDGISLQVAPGECLGVLGESGSGKSTLARAALGLLPEGMVSGRIRLAELDLLPLDEDGWRTVRWRRISLSFQSTSALNPVLRVGQQLAEPLRIHLDLGREAAAHRVEELLGQVGLGSWAAERYPSQLSGGQRRLVLLAMALACGPDVAILDEPTAGLDPATRNLVLDLLQTVRAGGTSLVVLSHDADALELLADRVAVLYRGWLAEIGPRVRVLGDPRNPYSWALLNARPTLASVKDLRGIRGAPPDPTEPADGCPFLGRCHQSRDELCAPAAPPLVPPPGEDGARLVACARGGVVALLSARDLRKTYTSGGILGRRSPVPVVDGISLDVREGEVVGLVGATGAGKSTLGLLLTRLLDPDAGTVCFDGQDLLRARGEQLKALRRQVQMLFQDPFEALSPRLTIGDAVREPLDVQELGDAPARRAAVRRALVDCRLPDGEAFLGRHTHELSGGQLQRVALARALVLEPRLLVADEAVSMLDPSEQAKMIQLLKHLQVERGMAMIFISHDLSVVLRVADRVLVLDGGRIVEEGAGGGMLAAPRHPVTRSLLAAAGRDLLFAGADGRPAQDVVEDSALDGPGTVRRDHSRAKGRRP